MRAPIAVYCALEPAPGRLRGGIENEALAPAMPQACAFAGFDVTLILRTPTKLGSGTDNGRLKLHCLTRCHHLRCAVARPAVEERVPLPPHNLGRRR